MSFLYLKITQESYNLLAFFVFSKIFRFLTNLMDTPIKKNTTSQQGTHAFCGRGFF